MTWVGRWVGLQGIVALAQSATGRVYAASLASQVAAAGASVVAARMLGPTDRGRLAAIVAGVALSLAVGSLGFDQAYVYYGAKVPVPSTYRNIILKTMPFQVLGSVLSFAVLTLLLNVKATAGAGLVLTWIVAAHLAGAINSWWQGTQAWTKHSVVRLALGVPPVAGALMLFTKPEVERYISGFVISLLLGAGFAVVLFLAIPGPNRGTALKGRAGAPIGIKGVWRYALYSWPSVASYGVNRIADQLVIAAILGPTSLGYYVVAASVASLLPPLGSAVAMVAFPRLAVSGGQSDFVAGVTQYVRRAGAVMAIAGIALGVGTVVLLPTIFGEAFAPAVLPAIILLSANVGSSLASLLADGLRAAGRPGAASGSEVAMAMLTVVLLLMLGRRGIVVVSLISLSVYWSKALINWWLVVRTEYSEPSGAGWL